jgi:squalene-hopene/tetraprenyl-beta-curcumene cyclase
MDQPRFRQGHFDSSIETTFPTTMGYNRLFDPMILKSMLEESIQRTQQFFLKEQHPDGHWCAELEGDSILESEYLLLLAYLEELDTDHAQQAGNYLRQLQNTDGSWSMFPGGSIEISASVKAYLALKLLGDDIQSSHMIKAREAILLAGGAEQVNSFTRYYLALLGLLEYKKCPAVPPELILLPKWFPINLSAMSSWSRTIVVPLSFLWAYKPVANLPSGFHIRELYLTSPEQVGCTMPESKVLDKLTVSSVIPWRTIFNTIDQTIKWVEYFRFKPLRSLSLKNALHWILVRFEESDGLGAIFPPIVWSIIALKVSGYAKDAPEMQEARRQLDDLIIKDGESIRLQPCKSPVWDTAITTLALRESGLSHTHPALEHARDWLLSKEVRVRGDWADISDPEQRIEPTGWFFEYRNQFYPDVDDTIMVMMALKSLLGQEQELWEVQQHIPGGETSESPIIAHFPLTVAGRVNSLDHACLRIQNGQEIVSALSRGLNWIKFMQGTDGGWGAFDKDNNREILTRIPFADHNAMIDPSTADITARTLEMYGKLGISQLDLDIHRAIQFVYQKQENDGSWQGRWGVNYLYGTWQVLVGLTSLGLSPLDPRLQRGGDWLESVQQANGGWGESAASYEYPELKGHGPATASQTAWALMGLMALSRHNSPVVQRGIRYLLEHQNPDGTWDEPEFTGTGFPKVFYLRYHYYRVYFPLMALGKYSRMLATSV